MTEDRLLISEILSGNKAAFQIFIERYQKLVAHVVFRMVSNEADREDISQEVFLKAYANLSGFEFGCKISTWVARIAHNTCLNYLEKKKLPLICDLIGDENGDALDAVPGDYESPVEFTEGRDLSRRIQEEVNLLPPLYGVLIALFHLEEMPYEQIAEVTGMPMGTVKNYLFRARKMLKGRLLEKYQPEEIWH